VSTSAEEFFAWEPHGIGRRWLPCPGCDSRAPVQLLENLMEVLCPSCGRSVALERVRSLEASQGSQALADCLVGLGLLEPEEAKALLASTPASELTDHLIDQGHLLRDLRLTLEVDGAEGRSVYRAKPLVDLALGAEVEAALETRSERGGVLTEILRESILQRLGATIRSVGASAGLECLNAESQTDWNGQDLSVRALESFRCVPLRREGETLVVALWNPIDFRLVADLEALVACPVDAVLADPRAIDDALARLGVTSGAPDPTAAARIPDGESFELAEDPFFGVLMEALEEGASEVLIEPRGVEASLRFRVRGELRKERALPREVAALLAEQLQGLISRPAGEDAGVCSGTIRYELSGLPVTLDCRILQTPLGPSVALVLEDEGSRAVTGLGQLGLSLEGLAALEAVLADGRGIVVVAGPQRIERTQAYHAILERAVRLGGGVISLEGRLGASIPGTTQLDLLRLKPSSFGTLLHPLPDWLGIDGPLGALTLRLAVDVALHGNAVVITVPAPDGESALLRLELAGVPRRLLEISVCAVLARRVLPRVCPHCRFARERRTPAGSQSYVGLGCAACADQGTAEPLPLAELVRPYDQGTQPFTGTAPLAERVRLLVEAGDVQPEAVSDLLGGVAAKFSAGY
jgi:type IV pilus assembly protein PilB